MAILHDVEWYDFDDWYEWDDEMWDDWDNSGVVCDEGEEMALPTDF